MDIDEFIDDYDAACDFEYYWKMYNPKRLIKIHLGRREMQGRKLSYAG